MKAFLRTYVSERLSGAVITFLFTLGLALPLRDAWELPVSTSALFLLSAASAFLFSLLQSKPVLRAVSLLLTLLGVFALLFPRWQTFYALFFADGYTLPQLLLTIQIHAVPLAFAACVIVSRVSTSMLFEREMRLIPFIYGFFLLMYLLAFFPKTGVLPLIPLLLAFVLSLATSAHFPSSPARALPMAAVCLLIAALALPAAAPVSQPLADLMARTRQFMDDYFFFTQSREVYSLHMSGYQPYGHDSMGGPISPADTPVMEVETPATALLRGVALNEYTGFSWKNTLPANRYLMVDPRFQNLRRQTFDLTLPDESIQSASTLFAEKALHVTLQKESFSTLFVPARTSGVSSQGGLVPYFGPSSEIFITRNLAPGDSYSLYAPLFTADSPSVSALVQSAQSFVDPRYDEIVQTYTALPDLVESEVYQLAWAVTQNAQTPFEQAQLLCEFLRTQYPYTYDQSPAPADRDFVSWFLLEEKQGYCVSYASALAVMGRIVGLPTRYIEGYVARPDADGIARVTELNAHAWVEIYFSGFGWVPFDPTPGSGSADDAATDTQDDPSDDSDGSDDGGASDAPTPTPSADDLSGGDGASDLPTPEPTATPTPTPEPDDSDNSDAPDTPTPPPADDPSATPTPPPADTQPSPTPTPTPPVSDPPEDDEDPDDSAPPLGWLALLLLLLAAVAARLYTSQPSFVVRRVHAPRAQLLVYYRALLMVLSCLHLGRTADESPLSHAQRVHRALDGDQARDSTGILRAAKIITRTQYSLRDPESGDVNFLQTVYIRLLKRMKVTQLLHYFALRLLHGAGNWRSI